MDSTATETTLIPGTVMIHERHTVVGVVGIDGELHTHNMSLPPRMVRRFYSITRDAVPTRLAGFFGAAERRAEEADRGR